MNELYKKTGDFLQKYSLNQENKTFLIGFSGGYDSICLLDILKKLSLTFGFRLIALHLNHNWRGEEAKCEEMNCKSFCEEKDIEFISETLEENSKKTETAAREYRQAFFKKYYEKFNADGLLLAHTKSDNAETLLYRMIKGTGINGLCGILEQNEINGIKIFRPLMNCSRTDIEDYVKENKLSPNNDSSNSDIKYKRNFIRTEILPKIKEINPQVENALQKLSQIAQSEQEIINEYLSKIKAEIFQDGKVLTKRFLDLSEAIRKKLILNFLIENEFEYDLKKVTEVFDFINENSKSKTGKTLSLSGDLWLFVSGKCFYSFSKKEKFGDEILIEKDGCYEFDNQVFRIEKYNSETKVIFPKETQNYAYVSNIKFPLALRYRKDGDIIQPFGMSGCMKIKKFFINKNIPKNERDSVILLCKENEILWAAGCCVSEKLKAPNVPEYVIKIENRCCDG